MKNAEYSTDGGESQGDGSSGSRLEIDLARTWDEIEAKPKHNPFVEAQAGLAKAANDNPKTDGAAVADGIANLFKATITAPAHAEDAFALFMMFTHAFDHARISPRLLFWSPTPECGKSEALKLTLSLARDAVPASNVSPAVLPRLLEDRKAKPPTLVVDEYDSMSPDVRSAVTNILNSGHEKALAYNIVSAKEGSDGDWTPKTLSTWGPFVLASKEKELAPASMSRSIVIRLEHDPDRNGDEYDVNNLGAEYFRKTLATWADENREALAAAFGMMPEMPDCLSPRGRSNWKHLFQIAHLLGGDWPARAWSAAEAISPSAISGDLGIRLLADIKAVFDKTGADVLWSDVLCGRLNDQEGSPWAGWNKGNGINKHDLAKKLRNFKTADGEPIAPAQVKKKGQNRRGYRREMFDAVFERYAAKLA